MKQFDDLDKFARHVGLVRTKNWTGDMPELEEDFNGYAQFSIKNLVALEAFCIKNPTYHIATRIESEEGNALVIDNRIRIVNREAYFLATKGELSDQLVEEGEPCEHSEVEDAHCLDCGEFVQTYEMEHDYLEDR